MAPPRLLLLGFLLLAGGLDSALAHHRKAPGVLRYTSSGDTELPRLPGLARSTVVLAIPSGADTRISTIQPFKYPFVLQPLGVTGDNQNPSISFSGAVVSWDTDTDPLSTGLPGRQIVLARRGTLIQGPADPSGTSTNPTLDAAGTRLAFESSGDLAGTGNPGMRQVFMQSPAGAISQVSRGIGDSTNPMLSPKKHLVTFQSTSDPITGLDTGVSQIWLGGIVATPEPITYGLASSVEPTFSDDAAVIAFESRANLGGDQTDLGAPQIFVYHIKTKTFAQITNEPGGCVDPAVGRFNRDWRVAYVCDGVAYVYFLRSDRRFTLDTNPGSHTSRIVPEPGAHFFVVATTGDLEAGSGTTAEHQVYQINSFKRPLVPLDAGYLAQWFPFRGVPPSY